MPSVGSTPTSSPASLQQTPQTSNSTMYGSSTSSSSTPNQYQTTTNSGASFCLNPFPTSFPANKSSRTKYSQFMIITPAVSIDRNFDNSNTGAAEYNEINETDRYSRLNLLNNNSSSNRENIPSKCTSKIHHRNRSHHLLSTTPNGFYTSSSWRWCTLLCAAMRCFGGGRNTNAPYTTSFSRTYSHNTPVLNANANYTSAPFRTPRRTRDHMNNVTYEL